MCERARTGVARIVGCLPSPWLQNGHPSHHGPATLRTGHSAFPRVAEWHRVNPLPTPQPAVLARGRQPPSGEGHLDHHGERGCMRTAGLREHPIHSNTESPCAPLLPKDPLEPSESPRRSPDSVGSRPPGRPATVFPAFHRETGTPHTSPHGDSRTPDHLHFAFGNPRGSPNRRTG